MSKSSEAINSIYLCFIALDNPNDVAGLADEYLDEHIPEIPLKTLLMRKRQETSNKNKEKLDKLIARKIISMEYILKNNLQELERYQLIVEDIYNIDAIIILLRSEIEEIFAIANRKYYEYYQNALDNDETLNSNVYNIQRGKGRIRTNSIEK